MRLVTVFAAAATCLSASSLAFAGAPDFQHFSDRAAIAKSAVANSTSATPENVVCRQMSHEGSLIQSQVCGTEAQWERLRRQEQAQLQEIQQRSLHTRGK